MAEVPDLRSANPFIRYRVLLDSYQLARARGWTDEDFVSLVLRLDEAVATVEGRGFRVTPLLASPELAAGVGLAGSRLWVKDDTGNVGGSHKGRHLFGVLLHHVIEAPEGGELAIASCGNAALAAAVVAKAEDRPLRVFIPTWADPVIVERLEALGARIEVCPRRPGEKGDPSYLRFLEAVESGAIPFSVQGTVTTSAIDGGRTLGWELADQLTNGGVEGRVRVFVQVGGGALATATWRGLQRARFEVILHPVQTEACAPLSRAWDLLTREISSAATAIPEEASPPDRAQAVRSAPNEAIEEALSVARAHPERFMWPWEEVGVSAATGILDDLTYDWLPIAEALLESAGWPIVVSEELILEANRLGRGHTGIDVDPTGTAGLAGLLDTETRAVLDPRDHHVVLFTGRRRG